jgi:hypothetical protein
MKIGDQVRVRKSRDTPAALGDKIAKVVKIDEISVWVAKDGLTYVLDRSQMQRIKPQ